MDICKSTIKTRDVATNGKVTPHSKPAQLDLPYITRQRPKSGNFYVNKKLTQNELAGAAGLG